MYAAQSPERCSGDLEARLAAACEDRLMAQAAYNEAILGAMIVRRNCHGKPVDCPEDYSALNAAKQQLDTAMTVYYELEHQFFYGS